MMFRATLAALIAATSLWAVWPIVPKPFQKRKEPQMFARQRRSERPPATEIRPDPPSAEAIAAYNAKLGPSAAMLFDDLVEKLDAAAEAFEALVAHPDIAKAVGR